MQRREFLRRASAGIAGSVALSTSTLAEIPRDDYQPEHVTIDYDADWLGRYQPKLVMEPKTREKLIGLYGWRVRSPEYEYDVGCYAASYTHQEGVSPISAALAAPLSDSHYGDHEWYYSFVKDGQLQAVVYDAYHWVAGKQYASSIPVDEQHPVAKVAVPWHMYHHNVSASEGALFDVEDLTQVFGAWLQNGLDEDLGYGTVVDPAVFGPEPGTGRGHWWQKTVGEFSYNVQYAQAMYSAGLLGAEIRGVSI